MEEPRRRGGQSRNRLSGSGEAKRERLLEQQRQRGEGGGRAGEEGERRGKWKGRREGEWLRPRWDELGGCAGE